MKWINFSKKNLCYGILIVDLPQEIKSNENENYR